jgi:hypothetical protein
MKDMIATCGILNTFATERKGVLDAKGLSELKEVSDKLFKLDSTVGKARDDVTSFRSRRADAYDKLRRSIMESKKAIEMVAWRDRKEVVVPKVSKSIFFANRIKALAADYLKALETAGKDATVDKAALSLKSAYDEYLKACSDATEKVFARRTFRNGLGAEIEEIDGRLDALVLFVAFHVSRDDRAELFSRIGAAMQRKAGRKDAATPAITGAAVPQPVAIVNNQPQAASA